MIKRHRKRGWDTARDNRGEKGDDRRKEFQCILVVLSWQTDIQYRSSFHHMATQRIHETPNPGCESHGSHLPAPALMLLHILVCPNTHTLSNHSPQSTSATSTATTAIFTAQFSSPRGQASCHKAFGTVGDFQRWRAVCGRGELFETGSEMPMWPPYLRPFGPWETITQAWAFDVSTAVKAKTGVEINRSSQRRGQSFFLLLGGGVSPFDG